MHAPWLDLGGSIVSVLGRGEVSAGIALGLAVARFRRYPRSAIVPLCIACTVVIEAALKIAVPQTPPPHEFSRTIELFPAIQIPFAHTFPSGHVARTAFLLRIANGIPTWFLIVAVSIIIVTRIYLAEHWLSETVGGLVLGLGVANVARRIE